jgi:hypothetical protein
MRCPTSRSTAISERPERTTQGYRRYRCHCGKQCNERSLGPLDPCAAFATRGFRQGYFWKPKRIVPGYLRRADKPAKSHRLPAGSHVARDRGGSYALAAAKALPMATQVADRWHLMVNAAAPYAANPHRSRAGNAPAAGGKA